MAHRLFLLKGQIPGNSLREARRRRKDLLYFFDTLILHLQVGYDLAYSWRETSKALQGEVSESFFLLVAPSSIEGERESQTAILTRLAAAYPDAPHRLWFSALRELYAQGAPLRDAVVAISHSLRQEQARDLEAHGRTLPARLNVALLLFFLPPTFVLLFAPLLHSLSQTLGSSTP
jgi:hypothetical protein